MKIFITIIFLFFITLVSLQSYSQGKIDRSKEEIKKGNKNANGQRGQSTQSAQSSKSDNEQSIGDIIAVGIVQGFLYLTYFSTIGDYKTEYHLHSNITKYPYYNKHSGNYESTDSNISKNHFRFDVDNQFLYSNKNLIGNHFKLNIRPFQYFYLQGQYHQLTEHNKNDTYSNLSLFNIHLCYDRLRFEKFNFGWKLGMSYISNHVNRGGFSFGLDAEAFLIKFVSLYVSKQWSSINHVPVNQFEVAGKFHFKRYNVHLGYEHLKIGNPLYDFISLGAGVRL
jgi:hypothetical protein